MKALAEELGVDERRLSVFGVGPAGENLVRIAAIMNDKERALARGGPGAAVPLDVRRGGRDLARLAGDWLAEPRELDRARGAARDFAQAQTGQLDTIAARLIKALGLEEQP